MNTTPTIEESILEKFDKNFPYPDHPRMSKCDCISEVEHTFACAWYASKEEVKDFILSALTQQRKHIAGEVEKLKYEDTRESHKETSWVDCLGCIENTSNNKAIDKVLTLLQTSPRR